MVVQTHSYTNPNSQKVEGRRRCCDNNRDNNCNNECDNVFIYCLRNAGNPLTPSDCPQGRNETSRDTTLPDDVQYDTPLRLELEGTVWPVSTFIMVVQTRNEVAFSLSLRVHFNCIFEWRMLMEIILMTMTWLMRYLLKKLFHLRLISLILYITLV